MGESDGRLRLGTAVASDPHDRRNTFVRGVPMPTPAPTQTHAPTRAAGLTVGGDAGQQPDERAAGPPHADTLGAPHEGYKRRWRGDINLV